MTSTTTDQGPGAGTGSAHAGGEPPQSTGPGGYDERVADLTVAYHRTVDTIMTTRYGSDWAARGDLPDDAYTTELVFSQWLSDLLDHIDNAASDTSRAKGN